MKHIVNFIIEFETLAMKTEIDNIHIDLLIKEECQKWHYQNNIGISIHYSTRNLKGMEGNNYISETETQVHRKQT